MCVCVCVCVYHTLVQRIVYVRSPVLVTGSHLNCRLLHVKHVSCSGGKGGGGSKELLSLCKPMSRSLRDISTPTELYFMLTMQCSKVIFIRGVPSGTIGWDKVGNLWEGHFVLECLSAIMERLEHLSNSG